MDVMEAKLLMCPYCGESFTVLVDCSMDEQNYIEDCQVCCQPIVLDVNITGEKVMLQARREDE